MGPLSWQLADAGGPCLLKPVTRRDVLAGMGLSAGFVMALGLTGPAPAHADRTAAGHTNVRGGDATPSLFIAIEPDGTVKLTCHRSEMGQQVWTSIAQILAEELEADWERVKIVQAFGHPRYGDQNIDGSRSVRRNLTRLRYAGAGMRRMLERAAADRWGADVAECRATMHRVSHEPTGRSLGYGELAIAAAALEVPGEDQIRLKPRSEWRYIGKPVPSLTVSKIIHGQGTFGIDVNLPGMVHAVIARPPQVFGRAEKVDDKAALGVPGVIRTVQLESPDPPAVFKPLGGIAVIAEDTWAAIRGRDALKIDWDPGPNADYDSDSFRDELMKTARLPAQLRRNRGNVRAQLENAGRRIQADYYAPHLSQTPMEPPSATSR